MLAIYGSQGSDRSTADAAILWLNSSDAWIEEYEAELVVLLKAGYLGEVTYGFKRGDDWIEPSLRYTAEDPVGAGTDDDPGRVRQGRDVSGASFYSYLTYSAKYQNASSSADKAEPLKICHLSAVVHQRRESADISESDKTYSAGSRALNRASVRSF